MADVLRNLADKLDSIEQGSELGQRSTQRLEPVEPKDPESNDSPVMVPPLQAKLEILKKSEGIPNVYDDEGDEDDAELAVIKKNAGLTAAQHEASEDNDVLG